MDKEKTRRYKHGYVHPDSDLDGQGDDGSDDSVESDGSAEESEKEGDNENT